MAKHRKDAPRGRKVDAETLIWYVRSLFVAIESGVVTLPKQVWHYARQIEKAYAGDLEPLRHAVKSVTTRTNIVRINPDEPETSAKWKVGMASHIMEILACLSAFEALLTAYHEAANGKFEQISKIAFGLETFKRNQKLCESRDEYERDYCTPSRFRL